MKNAIFHAVSAALAWIQVVSLVSQLTTGLEDYACRSVDQDTTKMTLPKLATPALLLAALVEFA